MNAPLPPPPFPGAPQSMGQVRQGQQGPGRPNDQRMNPERNEPYNPYADYDPEIALFEYRKGRKSSWADAEPVKIDDVSLEYMRDEHDRIRKEWPSPKRALTEVTSENAREIIKDLLIKENRTLWQWNTSIQWKFGAIGPIWREISWRARELKRVDIVLVTEPREGPEGRRESRGEMRPMSTRRRTTSFSQQDNNRTDRRDSFAQQPSSRPNVSNPRNGQPPMIHQQLDGPFDQARGRQTGPDQRFGPQQDRQPGREANFDQQGRQPPHDQRFDHVRQPGNDQRFDQQGRQPGNDQRLDQQGRTPRQDQRPDQQRPDQLQGRMQGPDQRFDQQQQQQGRMSGSEQRFDPNQGRPIGSGPMPGPEQRFDPNQGRPIGPGPMPGQMSSQGQNKGPIPVPNNQHPQGQPMNMQSPHMQQGMPGSQGPPGPPMMPPNGMPPMPQPPPPPPQPNSNNNNVGPRPPIMDMPGAFPVPFSGMGNNPSHFPPPEILDPHKLSKQKAKSKKSKHGSEPESGSEDSDSDFEKQSDGGFGIIKDHNQRKSKSRHESGQQSPNHARPFNSHKEKSSNRRSDQDMIAPPPMGKHHKSSSKDYSPKSSKSSVHQPSITINLTPGVLNGALKESNRDRDQSRARTRHQSLEDRAADYKRSNHDISPHSSPASSPRESFHNMKAIQAHHMLRTSSMEHGSETSSDEEDRYSAHSIADDSVFSVPDPSPPHRRSRAGSRIHSFRDSIESMPHTHSDFDRRSRRIPVHDDYPRGSRPMRSRNMPPNSDASFDMDGSYIDDHDHHTTISWPPRTTSRPGPPVRRNSVQVHNHGHPPRIPAHRSYSHQEQMLDSTAFFPPPRKALPDPRLVADERVDVQDIVKATVAELKQQEALKHMQQSQSRRPTVGRRNSVSVGGKREWSSNPMHPNYDQNVPLQKMRMRDGSIQYVEMV